MCMVIKQLHYKLLGIARQAYDNIASYSYIASSLVNWHVLYMRKHPWGKLLRFECKIATYSW